MKTPQQPRHTCQYPGMCQKMGGCAYPEFPCKDAKAPEPEPEEEPLISPIEVFIMFILAVLTLICVHLGARLERSQHHLDEEHPYSQPDHVELEDDRRWQNKYDRSLSEGHE